MLTVQLLAVPVQAPVQPAKREPVAGTAVSVTVLPIAIERLHVLPQSMLPSPLPTVPLPVPARATASVQCVRVKVAVAVLAASIVTVQGPLPAQAPLQPANADSAAAVGVRV